MSDLVQNLMDIVSYKSFVTKYFRSVDYISVLKVIFIFVISIFVKTFLTFED